ncbi:MAG: hypothetical protein AAF412_13455 [Pseudomonadota bacterium]
MKLIEWLKTAKVELVTFLTVASPILSQYFGIEIDISTIAQAIDTLIEKVQEAWLAIAALAAYGLRVLKMQDPPIKKTNE